MASKFHPLVDGFNRHLRKESREPQLTKAARQPYGDENRVRIADEHGNYEEHETTGSEEKSQDQAGFSRASVKSRPDRDAKTSPEQPQAGQHAPDRLPSDGGGSVGSARMRGLSIHDSSNPNSNKRPAVDPAHGSLPGDARPTKLRSGPSDDARGPAPTPQRALACDTARLQRADGNRIGAHARHSSYDDQLNSPPSMHRRPGLIARQNIRLSFQNHAPPHMESEQVITSSPSTSPIFNASSENDSEILLQPETRPITQEQLVNEVKGIYAGLVMVEKKCVEIDQQQGMTTNKLSNEQWQALIALHRTLLHEHHDFFLASQHPSSSPALRRLATKYAMPARMWRHGIHSFLELLRHRLPHSLDHMLAFVYLAYSMMALLMESVPSFEETWIECLGDLARYRMAIEEADLRDREVWSGVARMWYNKAADKSPNVGRIQHHLAVLARPNIVQQLFYYSKALVSVIPFQNARESIMLLFNPFLEGSEIAFQRYLLIESSFVKANGILFTHGSVELYVTLMDQFAALLDGHIGRITAKFRIQGPEIASTLCAATFDFGNAESFLCGAFQKQEEQRKAKRQGLQTLPVQEDIIPEDPTVKVEAMREYWALVHGRTDFIKANVHSTLDSTTKDATFSGSHDAAVHGCHSFDMTVTKVLARIGDKNILSFAHVILAYVWSLAFVPDALQYVEGCVPWESISIFLNTMTRSGVVEARFEGADFPQPLSGTGRQLPEDFIMRGLVWAQHYFPAGFFEGQVVDEDERTLELPSHAAPRAERCLWLGVQLASLDRWLSYDMKTKQFSVTEFGGTFDTPLSAHTLDGSSRTMSVEREIDIAMVDVKG